MANIKEQEIPFMVDTFSSIVKAGYIDAQTSEKIRAHITAKSSDLLQIDNCGDNRFNQIANNYGHLQCCYDWSDNVHYNDISNAADILHKFNLTTDNAYLTFRIQDKQKTEIKQISGNTFIVYKKYCILVFVNTILVFIDPADKPLEFLCALHPSALSVTYSIKPTERTVIVNDTSRELIDYYDKFNPFPTSTIISHRWTRTNVDGSRSFAGGLKPENNPLRFVLEHGELSYKLCGKEISCSLVVNAESAQEFADSYEKYLIDKNFTLCPDSIKQQEIFDNAFTLVKSICAPKKGIFSKYKTLSPLWKFLLPILIVFGGFMSVAFIVFIIEILMSLLI